MRVRHFITIALTALSAIGVAACATNDGRATQPPAEAPAEQAAKPVEAAQPVEAPKPVEAQPPSAAHLEHSDAEVTAPFVLTLEGPTSMPNKGEFEIIEKIKAHHELKVPTTISITLPKGAKLVGGAKASETLATLPAGETTRTFKVTPPGNKDPFRVVVDMKDPSRAMGAHAEKAYPAEITTYTRPSSAVPPPPVGRPGGPGAPTPKR